MGKTDYKAMGEQYAHKLISDLEAADQGNKAKKALVDKLKKLANPPQQEEEPLAHNAFLYEAIQQVIGLPMTAGDLITMDSTTNSYMITKQLSGSKYFIPAEVLGAKIAQLTGQEPSPMTKKALASGDSWVEPWDPPSYTTQVLQMLQSSTNSAFAGSDYVSTAEKCDAVVGRKQQPKTDEDELAKRSKWASFFRVGKNLERAIVRFKGDTYKDNSEIRALRDAYTRDDSDQWWYAKHEMVNGVEAYVRRKVSFIDVPEWIREDRDGPPVDGNFKDTNEILKENPKLHLATGLSSRVRPQHNMPDMHKIVLDIDHDAALIESSTPGHFHLMIDKYVTWDDYKELLRALAKCGVIEEGYAGASIRRGATWIRAPWHKKGQEVHYEPESED